MCLWEVRFASCRLDFLELEFELFDFTREPLGGMTELHPLHPRQFTFQFLGFERHGNQARLGCEQSTL